MLCLCSSSEPSKVQLLTATHAARDNYLKVYWSHASGDFDFYQVFIKHNNIFLQNTTVSKAQHECVFENLVPGRLYTVLVHTRSGKYETSASTDGRTRELHTRTHREPETLLSVSPASMNLWL